MNYDLIIYDIMQDKDTLNTIFDIYKKYFKIITKNIINDKMQKHSIDVSDLRNKLKIKFKNINWDTISDKDIIENIVFPVNKFYIKNI